MTRLNKFLAATSVLAMLGVPAVADTMIGGSAGLGATLHVNTGTEVTAKAGADADADTAVQSGDAVASTDGAVAATVDTNGDGKIDGMDDTTAMAQADIVGNGVWSNDGMMLGKVQSVSMTDEGKLRVIVALDDSVSTDIERFSVDLAADAKVDGDLKLGWTEAELITALEADAKANG